MNKPNELGQNASVFMARVDEKLKELQSTFKGLVFKPSTSKARKRKQNKRKGIKRKLARMENAKTRVLPKVLPRVNHDNVDITIGVEDIFIAALGDSRKYPYPTMGGMSINKFIKKGGKGFAGDAQVRQPILRSC